MFTKLNPGYLSCLKLKIEDKEGHVTYIFVSVGVLVLRLIGHWHFTIGAVVLTVVIGSTMVCYNH